MKLEEIYTQVGEEDNWIVFEKETFFLSKKSSRNKPQNRETLARIFDCQLSFLENRVHSQEMASRLLRQIWTDETRKRKSKSMPSIVLDDGFLCMYALGIPLSSQQFLRIHEKVLDYSKQTPSDLNPINVDWNRDFYKFHDVDATPPGILSKLFTGYRLQKDEVLLKKIQEDLHQLAFIEDDQKRTWLSLAVLSHAAAYRELEGRTLLVPNFHKKDELITYSCTQHLIADGVKTISLLPFTTEARGIYLCQGTELWPSQPSALGSVIANFAVHGSATDAYAHSWRRIHKHLRDLVREKKILPLVAGHSMGGALAMQMGLYSHDLLEAAYAFNPPLPHARDYAFYHNMDDELKRKILVTANLDDFAFWHIGAKIIGETTVFLGKKRWRYFPVTLWDCLLILPAITKFILNIRHAFPAHQHIFAFGENYVYFKLTPQEIEKENQERLRRFDYLSFFPKLYDPMKALLRLIRTVFRWKEMRRFLEGEIEIIALHERDLIDTMNEENAAEIQKELEELKRQKERLIARLRSL